jgi:hypothetical protein
MQSGARALLDEVLPVGKNGMFQKISTKSKNNSISALRFSFKSL